MFKSADETKAAPASIEPAVNEPASCQPCTRWAERRIPAIRAGRLAFGIVTVAGALLLTQTIIDEGFETSTSLFAMRDGGDPPVHVILVWTWLLAFIAGSAVHLLVRIVPALHWVRPRGTTSLVVPAVGAALLLPITVHLGWYVLNGMSMKHFDQWAVFAIALTCLAHIGFAWMTGVRARRLARGETPVRVKNIFAWTVVLAALPFGIFLLAIPPVLVAITGFPIVPLLVLMENMAVVHRDVELPTVRVLA